jgi:hypothetical protein
MTDRMSRAEAAIARVLADPYTHKVNTDGGAAAAEFIHDAAAGKICRPVTDPAERAEREAARQARWLEVLAATQSQDTHTAPWAAARERVTHRDDAHDG